MISAPVRKTALRKVEITVNELNQLLFWAGQGVGKSRGGSYWNEVQETIKEYKQVVARSAQN